MTEETKPEVQLEPSPCVLRMTLEITRAETGKVETFEVIGTPITEGETECQ